MIIDKDRRWAFIHIPKNGGTSLREALTSIGGIQHDTVWHPQYHVHKMLLQDIPFVFAITRCPYSRVVSNWLHVVTTVSYSLNKPDHERVQEIIHTHRIAVTEGIRGCLERNQELKAARGKWRQFDQQYKWIQGADNVTTFKLEDGMDHICRWVSARIGRSVHVRHANPGRAPALRWQLYLEGSDLKERVYRFYKTDFEMFGYEK